jgi:sialate O-acetylesterase
MMKRHFLRVLVAIGLLGFILGAQADFKIAPVFSDNMVLQQGQSLPVWGWADDGETVTVKFRGQAVSAKAWNGKWSLRLRRAKAGGPDTFTVSSHTRTVTFTNVLVGEVWVCSGQSNMEWPMERSFDPAGDIASATNTLIRLFEVPNVRSDAPSVVIKSAWRICSPEAIKGFSAVGYYFGRELQQTRRVPVGLIRTDWGGSPAEAWMSRESLEINPRYQAEILDVYPAALKNYQTTLAAWEAEKAEAENAGKEFKKWAPWMPWKPSELYNGMIAPLMPYAFKGAIWYQGESNAGRAEQYRTLFPDMIRCWRRDWAQNDFPFLLVQLAPFKAIKEQPDESDWAELREAQLFSTTILPNVGMAVITDVGDPKDIHPTKKQPVGERLALAARGIAYGEKLTFSGPIYRSLKIEGGKAILSFDHAGKGLEARDGALKGFAVCGEDRKFVWADAEIIGNTVVVSSAQAAKLVAVRYGWADCPVVNLWNKDGLPATPFRTDDFPMITAPKK